MGLELIFYAVFVLVLGNIVYQMMKNRGLRGAMFGATGLEIITTSVASYHTFPIRLTSAQATMLIEHLAHGIQRQQPRLANSGCTRRRPRGNELRLTLSVCGRRG